MSIHSTGVFEKRANVFNLLITSKLVDQDIMENPGAAALKYCIKLMINQLKLFAGPQKYQLLKIQPLD